jgi:uncharacterized SAM-binding protein YcdF (DUF218 family)
MVEMSSDAKTAPPGHETATEEDIPPAKPARAVGRRRKWAGRAIGLGIVVLLLGVTAGFLRFAEHVAALEPPGQLDATDAIVVLTGGSQRIDQAITLLKDGIGQRLLISGVNPRTTGREIQAMTSGSPELFDCCVDIGHDAIDTIGNANETARWINEHGFGRVLIVTNNYHIPRSLLELRRVDRSTDFVGYPVRTADLKSENWLAKPEVARLMISEYAKYSWAWVRAIAGTKTASGLRTDLSAASTGASGGLSQ